MARGTAGLAIIDVSNPAAPVLRNTILPFAHADISDVQVVNGIAYLANEVPNGSPTPHVGMLIYDVRNPLAPVELGRLEWGAGGGYHLGCDAHSVTIEVTPTATNAYLASGITGDLRHRRHPVRHRAPHQQLIRESLRQTAAAPRGCGFSFSRPDVCPAYKRTRGPGWKSWCVGRILRPPARGLQAASRSARAETKRRACGCAHVEAA